MMRFVREHVGEHGASGGPGRHPTVAREFPDTALRLSGQGVGQHAEALRRAFPVCRSDLPHRAPMRIERRGAVQMRGGISQPRKTVVVQMRKDGGDGAALPLLTWKLRAPGTWIKMGKQKLVHGVVDRVGLQQRVANLSQGPVGRKGHKSSTAQERTERLLNALRLAIGPDQGIEDCQHVAPVIDHALKNIFQLRVAFGLAVPLGEDGAGNLDIATQLVGGMTAEKQAVEKRRLALRILEILQRIGGNELWQRGHKEKCSLPKSVSASSRTCVFLTLDG